MREIADKLSFCFSLINTVKNKNLSKDNEKNAGLNEKSMKDKMMLREWGSMKDLAFETWFSKI